MSALNSILAIVTLMNGPAVDAIIAVAMEIRESTRIHRFPRRGMQALCTSDGQPQWAMGLVPPSLTLRRASASGTAAREISIKVQKASM
jgi:hypothetical protein